MTIGETLLKNKDLSYRSNSLPYFTDSLKSEKIILFISNFSLGTISELLVNR